MYCGNCGQAGDHYDVDTCRYKCDRPSSSQDPLINAIGSENATGTLIYFLARQSEMLTEMNANLASIRSALHNKVEAARTAAEVDRLKSERDFHQIRADKLEERLERAVQKLEVKAEE